MNRLVRASIGGLLLIVCATALVAQDPKKKRKFDHAADIVTEYNKDRNETKVELKQINVTFAKLRSEHQLNLTAYFIYPGKTPSKPTELVLGFISASYDRERKFQDFREFKASIDGKQESLGTFELIDSRFSAKVFKEVLGIFLPWDVFVRLTENKKDTMEMSIGNVRFQLDKIHLEALRDLASRAELSVVDSKGNE